jgi:hypothetical protein
MSSSVAVAAPAELSSANGATEETLFGVHQDVTWDSSERAIAVIEAAETSLHPEISRNSLLWHMIEETPGIRNWARTDAVVRELRAADIEPLLVVYGSPSWANSVPRSTNQSHLYVPPPGPMFERWLSEYTDFVRAAAARYSGMVRKWEIWNEPNERFFWKPAPDPFQFMRVYTALRQAILETDPSAQVAVGGLSGLVVGCCIYARDFLRPLIDAGVPIDYLAIHPYSRHAPDVHVKWQGNFDDIDVIRAFLDSNGLASTDLWVTEWGWSSQTVGLDRQASYLATSLELLRTRYSYVHVATVFTDHDRGTTYLQGLLDASLAPKPAGVVFANFMEGRSSSSP